MYDMKNSIKIVTSGTGIEKAANIFKDQILSGILSASYTELLMAKNGLSKYFSEDYLDELDPVANKREYEFIKSLIRDKVLRDQYTKSLSYVPDVNFYKMVLPASHRHLLNTETEKDDFTGWTKILSDPYKNINLLRPLIKGLFGFAKGKDDVLNRLQISGPLNKDNEGGNPKVPKVVQFFVGSPSNETMDRLGDIFQECLGSGTIVRVLSGSNDATNKTAESLVKKDIERCKSEDLDRVVIISKNMGSRSFSVPEIDAVVLMFDNGSVGSLVQKISRALTGGLDFDGNKKNKGFVISLSLDPNRSDNVDLFIVEEATKNRHKSESIAEVARKIRRSINIFAIDDNGEPVELLQQDDYYDELCNKFNYDTLKNTQVNLLPLIEKADFRDSVLEMSNSDVTKKQKKEKQLDGKGKKFTDGGESGNGQESDVDSESEEKLDLKTLKEAVLTIPKSILSIVAIDDNISGPKSFRSVLKSIKDDHDKKSEFLKHFNICPSVAIRLLDEEVINEKFIDFCLSRF